MLLVRDLPPSARCRPRPPPRARARPRPRTPAHENAAPDRLTAYNVIVAKYLFSPSRTRGRAGVAKPRRAPSTQADSAGRRRRWTDEPCVSGRPVDEARVRLSDRRHRRRRTSSTRSPTTASRSSGPTARLTSCFATRPSQNRRRRPPATPPPGQPGAPVPPRAGAVHPDAARSPGQPPMPPRPLRRLPCRSSRHSE